MAIEPPKFGGRKDLVDRMAGRQPYGSEFEAVEEWKREQYVRDVAAHPWRDKLLYWTLVAVLVLLGVGALTE